MLKERIRELESSFREKEKLEESVSHRNEEMLLSAADACDHKGLYDRPMEWAESYVAGQTQELQALSYEERGSIYPDSGLSL